MKARQIKVWFSDESGTVGWGSEYQTSLVFKWSKRDWMPNDMVFTCHLITGQMDAILFSYLLVKYSNGWSGTWDIAHGPTI